MRFLEFPRCHTRQIAEHRTDDETQLHRATPARTLIHVVSDLLIVCKHCSSKPKCSFWRRTAIHHLWTLHLLQHKSTQNTQTHTHKQKIYGKNFKSGFDIFSFV